MPATPLWSPSTARIEQSNLSAFSKILKGDFGQDYKKLWQFSVDNREAFWNAVWDFCGVVGDKGLKILENGNAMPGAKFFPEARLNFAENLLRERDEKETVIAFWGEDKVKRQMNFGELKGAVAAMAAAFRKNGVQAGDKIAAYIPNMPEAVIGMLAASSIGAVWSSCSPDFGVRGILDRFGQIEPKIFITADGYYYKGKVIDCAPNAQEVLKNLPTVQKTFVIPYVNAAPKLDGLGNAQNWDEALKENAGAALQFARLPFNHPLYIMFSSGTTGVPKCIVHGAGGTLLQHVKEHILQCDLKPKDVVFYATTCGWMMWNWLVSALAAHSQILLYDGFTGIEDGKILFDFCAAHKAALFGTSAGFIKAMEKAGLNPAATHDLSALRIITSTGSPLLPDGFDYIYTKVKKDVQLASISGGTDIISCFVLGNPWSPVYRGEIQAAGLGMDVDTWDENGKPIRDEAGELVCTKPFPSMPIYFGNDADGKKYHKAYFARFPNVWCHGDYASISSQTGGMVIYGRSDATLNANGVRIGTAEIYNIAETMPEIQEAMAIGQEWEGDTRIVLFLKMRGEHKLTPELEANLRTRLRKEASPRHVPAVVIAVPDLPRTRSGKLVELAVREVVHNRPVKNIEALLNPEALEHFRDLPQLKLAKTG